jgi:hypothetical protein
MHEVSNEQPRKRIRSGEGTLIGNAGECYVMAELLKRGVIAALAPRNAPGFDILATKGGKDVRIRVKTKSEQWSVWQWNAKKDGTIFRHLQTGRDFTVLVDLTVDTSNMKYYIIPTNILSDWLQDDFLRFISTPGRGGKARDQSSTLRNLGQERDAERIVSYCNRWETLWE